MEAREYLGQINRYDAIIERKKQELERLADERVILRCVDYSSDKVQASSSGEGFTIQSIKLIDRENEILGYIATLSAKRQMIIDQIYALKDGRHIRALCLRYVDDLRTEEMAERLGCSYSTALRILRESLEEFSEMYVEVLKAS